MMKINTLENTLIDLNLALRALESANDGVTIVDVSQSDQPLIYVNKSFERITGYSHTEILGRNCRFLQGNVPCEPERAIIRKAIKNRTSCRVVLKNFTKEGVPFWNELSLAPITSPDSHADYFMGIQKDISTDVFQKEKVLHLSQHDELTDLYNYRGFFIYSDKLLEKARKENQYFGIGILDVDNFKKINDILGHHYGNTILQTLAHELRVYFDKEQVISRMGSDEFIFSLCLKSDDTS